MLAECGHSVDYDRTLREFSGATMADRLAATRQRLGWTPPGISQPASTDALPRCSGVSSVPVPGIRRVLDRLERPWCVASNGSQEDITLRLRLAGLLEHFNPRLFSATKVAHGKPAPDLFLHAAAAMGTAPDRCVVVEDSLRGVQAGVRAGMTVLGFARLTSPDALREAGAMRVRRHVVASGSPGALLR